MIHKILNAYFAIKKPQKATWDIVLSIVFTVIFIISNIVLLFLEFNVIIKLVIQIIIAVLFLTFVVYSENKRCQKWKNDFNEYNTTLDEISKILKSFEYQNDSGCCNWHSKEKIEYLIDSAKRWITERNESKAKLEKLVHVVVLPVVGFVAAVIQNNATVEDAVSIGFLVIVAVVIGYAVDRGVSMVVDAIIKTASVDRMTMLLDLLQDLKARDFT